MATKRPAPNKENCLSSRCFDFDLDDNDFEIISKQGWVILINIVARFT